METFFATTIVVAIAMTAMALGVMFSGRRLRGSCGGVPGGKDCTCSLTQRKACELRAADADYGTTDDRHHHLDVVDERERS